MLTFSRFEFDAAGEDLIPFRCSRTKDAAAVESHATCSSNRVMFYSLALDQLLREDIASSEEDLVFVR